MIGDPGRPARRAGVRAMVPAAALVALMACGDAVGPRVGDAPAALQWGPYDTVGIVGEPLARPLVLRVVDSAGLPVPDVPVEFESSSSGCADCPDFCASFEAADTRSDWLGRVRAVYRPGIAATTYIVVASWAEDNMKAGSSLHGGAWRAWSPSRSTRHLSIHREWAGARGA